MADIRRRSPVEDPRTLVELIQASRSRKDRAREYEPSMRAIRHGLQRRTGRRRVGGVVDAGGLFLQRATGWFAMEIEL